MRVVHLIDSLHVGGTELHVLKLTRALQARSIPVRLVSIGRTGPLLDEYEALGVSVTFVPVGSFRSLRLPGRLRALRRELDRDGTTVVHAHDIYSNLAGAIVRPCRSGWRFLASQRWGRPEHVGWRVASAFSFHRANQITANGHGTAAIARALAPRAASRVTAIPNFLELECFEPVDRESLRRALAPDMPVGARVLGYVGRLDAQKRVDWLVDGLQRARSRGVEAHLVVVGDGADRKRLEQYAEAIGLTSTVHFAGLRKRLPLPHGAFDVIALASETEGVPNCLVEAMAAGTPIVATAVGGVPDVLGNGAWGSLVPPNRREVFIQHVAEALAEPGRRSQQAVAAAAHARSLWHEAVVLSDLLALYR